MIIGMVIESMIKKKTKKNKLTICGGNAVMNEYINLTLDNIDDEHICCAIGDKKHQSGVDSKKEWIKSKLKDGHIFRKILI